MGDPQEVKDIINQANGKFSPKQQPLQESEAMQGIKDGKFSWDEFNKNSILRDCEEWEHRVDGITFNLGAGAKIFGLNNSYTWDGNRWYVGTSAGLSYSGNPLQAYSDLSPS